MPLASSGPLLSFGRQASHILNQVPNISTHRSIHIPSFIPRAQTHAQPSHAQRLLRQTRGLLQAFVGHLTAPGTLGNRVAGSRAIHGAAHATRGQTIQQGLSFPTRCTLSRPLSTPKLPRPPVVPRSVTQVGLGTARNFSSSRPIFQHLVENVPITGRAFSQLDLEARMKDERRAYYGKEKKVKKVKVNEKVKAEKVTFHPAVVNKDETAVSTSEDELNRYFPAASRPRVTTTLLIPLAPTPTSRLPLPVNPSSSTAHPLLPISVLNSLHQEHTLHSLRVSTIFARLDAANVWASTVNCDAYGDMRGEASVLRIRFEGWEAKEVRSVIGESGKGWCVLEEEREDEDPGESEREIEDVLSQISMSSHSSEVAMEDFRERAGFEDPGTAQSLVLPTLDFSFSSSAPALRTPLSGMNTPTSDLSLSDIDMFSDFGSVSDSSGSRIEGQSVGISRAPSTVASSWVGFSSSFSDRLYEPRDEMF
ncbi:hypothetical protein EW146_g407 [Bondarzewia mesenterica]|uniref:Uncharacterized protein n=1 Tax=Bondarzewia mesenterica TaxID=1095465 RepID=A0A4S4M9E1_9AGAM|nr:hypothetical protein EW146_g407 [Bondarzewia mesenterica]